MQIERLRRIAELSGGRCLGLLELGQLPALLDGEPHRTTVRTQVPLWDSGWVLLALVVLMGGEWMVRRRYDLP